MPLITGRGYSDEQFSISLFYELLLKYSGLKVSQAGV